MREHVSQSKKATTASFSIPSLKHRIPGFGLESSQASPQAVPLVQPLHKPLTHDISRIPLRDPQAKLSISQPGDKYEQEADSVAQQVMQRIAQPVNRQSIQRVALPEGEELQMKSLANSIRPLQRQEMPEDESELQMKSLDNSTLQRQEAPEEEEELQMKPIVQRQAEAGMADAPDLEASINQARSGGQAMAKNIRHPMEQAFGADFSGVKVHTDGQSDQLNRSIQARAFTTGQDVFFRQGEYNPGSRGGQELLAHELTHVVQQNGGAVMRSHLPTQQLPQKPNIETPSASVGDLALQAKGDKTGNRQVLSEESRPNQTGLPDNLKAGVESVSGYSLDDVRVHSSSALNGREIIQMVRMDVPSPVFPINLATLETLIVEIDEQIRSLQEENLEEVDNKFIEFKELIKRRSKFNQKIRSLRQLDDGAMYKKDEISTKADSKLTAYYSVCASLNQMRKDLNDSLSKYTEYLKDQKEIAEQENTYKEFKAKKGEKEEKKTKVPAKKTPSGKSPIGLDGKWGSYKENLKWKNQTEFNQYVPSDSETIAKCLSSQKLTDAVYHTGKAFWVSDPKQFQLGSAAGKALMVYKFSPQGARSLMEDYLICGSGDYDEDNEEKWGGETAHPDYTIWKPNELGAYGIGSARLAQLESHIVSIEAYDPKKKKISI